MHIRRLILLALTSASLLTAGLRAQSTYVYTDLGDAPIEPQAIFGVTGNVTKSVVEANSYGISNTGHVVGDVWINASNVTVGNPRGNFRTVERETSYFSGKTHSFGTFLSGNNSIGYAVNSAGQIAGVSETSGSAFFIGILFDGLFHSVSGSATGGLSSANAVNEAGHVAGYAEEEIAITSRSSLITEKAIIWKGVIPQFLPDLSSVQSGTALASVGTAINSSDQVAGWSYVTTSGVFSIHGCIMQVGHKAIDVGTLAGPLDTTALSYANGINNASNVCGNSTVTALNGTGNAVRVTHAFLYSGGTNGTMTDLGVLTALGGRSSSANAINNSGTIVGQADEAGGSQFVAMRWTALLGMQDLNDPTLTSGAGDWVMEIARGINDSGQIVGTAVNSVTGDIHGFLLTPTALAAPPAVSIPPTNFQALVGQNITIASNITGSSPLTFQWFDNGVAIPGATSANFSLPNVQLAASGNYSVVASNLVGNGATNVTLSVIQAATITAQPIAAGALAGRPASFTVGAVGSGTLSYQWQLSTDGGTSWTSLVNNSTYSGVGNATLSISVTTLSMNGQLYRCIINNVANIPATTVPAVLAVGVPPTITIPPSNLIVNQGNNASLTVTGIGTAPISYQWSHAGVAIPGANTATLSLTNAQTATGGSYSVVVANPLGTSTATANVTVILLPNVTKQPTSVGLIAGRTATFSVTATGTPTLTYQWQSSPDGNNPWTNLSNGTTFTGVTTPTLSVANVSLVMNGTIFRCVVNNPSNVAVPSNGAMLTVGVVPTITTGPLTQAANQGSSPVLSVIASGTAPLAYQWNFAGKPILGATSSTYTITNAQTVNAGVYSVVVSNAVGNATASGTVSVTLLPVITSQPTTSTVIVGKPTSFKVTATGTPTLTYQWQQSTNGGATFSNLTNVAPFSGVTTPTLAISNATALMTGFQYQVLVNNPSGVANTSIAAQLNTGLVPTIAVPATDAVGNHTVNQGTGIVLSVNPSGTAPFTYVWKHGTTVLGSVTNSLTIANPQAADAGAYSVLVTNAYGNVTSTGNLTVTLLPVITTQPANSTVIVGKPTSFNITATGTPTLTYQWQQSTNGGATFSNLTNVAPFSGVTTPTLAISNATALMTGSQYRAIVNNPSGVANTSIAAQLNTGLVPTIAVPATDAVGNHTVNQGTGIVLSVNPSGTAPFTYVWKHGTTVLASVTNSLTISNPQAADAGVYSVLVTNPYGNVTSTGNLTVILLPVITTQPANSTVIVGKPTSFNITATGTPTLTYQWQQSTNGGATFSNLTNVAPFSGVTTPTLAISNATALMTGSQYRAIVNNPSGVANTSIAAQLNTGVIPTITSAPGNQTINQNSSTTFNVTATGTGTLTYQWSFGTTTLSGNGANTSSLSITNAQSTDAGKYAVTVINAFGSATASANLTVINLPAITTQPVNQTIIASKPASFKVTATGTPTLTYQWQSSPDGVAWTNLTNNGTVSGVTTATFAIPTTNLTMNGTQFRAVVNNGASPAAPATSNAAILYVGNPPAITSLTPGNSTVNQNTSVTYNVTATGTANLTYAWSVNGVTLGGQTASTLNIPSAQGADAGKYAVQVSNLWGNATASSNLTVIILPVVNSGGQPASFAAAVGKSATFSVSAGGTGPLTYQWQISTDGGTTFSNILSGNTTLSGFATSKLTVGTTSFAMNGWKFRVSITNASGTIIVSTPATLTVGNPPVITSPPTNKTANVGDNVTLTVLASGDPTLTYQWFLGANPLSGQTASTLNLTNVQTSDAGNYFVTVTNAYGNASGQSTLTVNAVAITPSLAFGSSSSSSAPDFGAGSGSSSGGVSLNLAEPGSFTVSSGDLASVIVVPGSSLTPADVSAELLAAMNVNATSDATLLPAASTVESGSVTYATLQFRQAKSTAGLSLTVQYGYATGSSAPTAWLTLPANSVSQQADADANTSVYQAHIPVPQGQTVYFKISTTP